MGASPPPTHECPVLSEKVGYLQAIDWDHLPAIVAKFKTTIQVNKQVGEFIGYEEAIFFLERNPCENDNLKRELNEAFVIGKDRSASADPLYGLQQTVDIALRGISPGVNDLSTTQVAIDYLTSILLQLADRDFGKTVLFHEETPIIWRKRHTFAVLLEQAFHAIQANAQNQRTILEKIRESILKLEKVTKEPSRRKALENYTSS